MVIFAVDGKEYSCYESWNEMTLKKGIELATVCNEMPSLYKDLLFIIANRKGDNDEEYEKAFKENTEKQDDEYLIKTLPLFFSKVLLCLSNIPKEVIDKINAGTIVSFYQTYLSKFVFGVTYFPTDLKDLEKKGFHFDGVDYALPESLQYPSENRPMAKETALVFAEAADLMLFSKDLAGGKMERAANIISILCRPIKNGVIEPYDELKSLQRVEKMKELRMDIVWQVFFCLHKQSTSYKINTSIPLLKEALEIVKQDKRAELIT